MGINKIWFFTVDESVCNLGVLSQYEMENCTKPKTYDYFDGSEVSYALTFSFIGLFIVGELFELCVKPITEEQAFLWQVFFVSSFLVFILSSN